MVGLKVINCLPLCLNCILWKFCLKLDNFKRTPAIFLAYNLEGSSTFRYSLFLATITTQSSDSSKILSTKKLSVAGVTMKNRARTVHKTSSKKQAPRELSGQTDLPLVNKLVITTRNSTKRAKKLCEHLRKIFDPDGFTQLKEKHPRLQDFIGMADSFRIGHVLIVSDNAIQVGVRPHGPTYTFKIVEYDESLKTYTPEIFKTPPFVTFGGKSHLEELFENFGKNKNGFKRVLHVEFKDENIVLRHYCLKETNTEDNYVLGYKEIGPRLTLELTKTEDGFYPAHHTASHNKKRL
ncbi:hypothetical protein PAEPH01_2193 [Pancytospora epiphaga]|nr:hypothetical protein PAEPH01_2193 [Pancytospora epiphaga]